MTYDPKVIVALDYAEAKDALSFVEKVDPRFCNLKVGKELFTAAGPALVEKLVNKDFRVFLDLKFHDIPNTVAKACTAAAKLGVWIVNVHASGGPKMMSAAAEALSFCHNRPKLIAVTVLTSMDDAELNAIGINATPALQVERLAKLAKECGLDGVVASAREVPIIRTFASRPFLTVTPGIRPAGSDVGDQKRIMTPGEAVRAGSDYLVIGRPITKASDPLEALDKINQEIAVSLS